MCQRSKDSSVSVSLGTAWLSFGSAAAVSCLYSWCVLVPRMPVRRSVGVGVPAGAPGSSEQRTAVKSVYVIATVPRIHTHIYIYIYISIHTLHTHTHTHQTRHFKMGFMKLMKN